MSPQRVQLSRAKGWRKPENTVVVARPSRWGNPFKVIYRPMHPPYTIELNGVVYETAGTKRRARELAVSLYSLHVGPMGSIELDDDDLVLLRSKLAGKNLACWCPLDQPCHADVLLELANQPEELTFAEEQEHHDEDLANHQLDVERDERLLDR